MEARPQAGSPFDSPIVLRLTAFVLFVVAWQTYAVFSGDWLTPTFSETAVAVASELGSIDVWLAFGVSNVAMVVGFGLSVLVGVPLGLLMGRFEIPERVIAPYLKILLATPLVGLVPLLVMSFGIGLEARVIIVWSFAIVMIVETSRVGARQTDPTLIEMARVFGANELQIWRRVLLPAAFPAVLSGIRIGLGRAIEGMVVVELIMVAAGIGGLILKYQAFLDGPRLYGIVFLVVGESLLLLWAADAVGRRLTPWAPPKALLG